MADTGGALHPLPAATALPMGVPLAGVDGCGALPIPLAMPGALGAAKLEGQGRNPPQRLRRTAAPPSLVGMSTRQAQPAPHCSPPCGCMCGARWRP
jgi:hypothetical protein